MPRKKKEKFKVVYKTEKGQYVSCHAFGDYKLTYKIGEITKAIPHTKGVFIFDSLKQAKNFINKNFLNPKEYKILKILPIGRKSRSIYYTGVVRIYHLNLFYTCIKFRKQFTSTPPLGTSCYPEVKVLKLVTFKTRKELINRI